MYGLHETMIITILIAHLIQLKSFSVVDVQTRPTSQAVQHPSSIYKLSSAQRNYTV